MKNHLESMNHQSLGCILHIIAPHKSPSNVMHSQSPPGASGDHQRPWGQEGFGNVMGCHGMSWDVRIWHDIASIWECGLLWFLHVFTCFYMFLPVLKWFGWFMIWSSLMDASTLSSVFLIILRYRSWPSGCTGWTCQGCLKINDVFPLSPDAKTGSVVKPLEKSVASWTWHGFTIILANNNYI